MLKIKEKILHTVASNLSFAVWILLFPSRTPKNKHMCAVLDYTDKPAKKKIHVSKPFVNICCLFFLWKSPNCKFQWKPFWRKMHANQPPFLLTAKANFLKNIFNPRAPATFRKLLTRSVQTLDHNSLNS
jgi:hypothetical protein